MCGIVCCSIGNVQTCNVDQIFKLEDRSKAYLCKLSPDEKILFCNSGEKLITYDLTNQCRSISTVELQGMCTALFCGLLYCTVARGW